MFEYLKGVIDYKKPEYLAIDVNGVGYRVNISLKTYDKVAVGEVKKLYIHNYIKEDAFKLIGFLDEKERTLFELLLGVSGIGVSLALAIMSNFEPGELKKLVVAEDFKTLKKVPKLGEKKSKQLILDLKEKISLLHLVSLEKEEVVDNTVYLEEELYLALDSLGYSKKEIDSLISKEELKNIPDIESAIKYTLKKIRDKK